MQTSISHALIHKHYIITPATCRVQCSLQNDSPLILTFISLLKHKNSSWSKMFQH